MDFVHSQILLYQFGDIYRGVCESRENFYGKVQSEDIKIMYKHFLEPPVRNI